MFLSLKLGRGSLLPGFHLLVGGGASPPNSLASPQKIPQNIIILSIIV